jgi:protein TonB
MTPLKTSTPVAGALEIKLAYRKNLLRGILLASFGIFGAAFVFGFAIDDRVENETRPPASDPHGRDSLYIMPPPPIDFDIPKGIPPRPDLHIELLKQPEFGEVKPVEDDEALNGPGYGSLDELKDLVANTGMGNYSRLDGAEIGLPGQPDDLPSPDTFIVYEEAPAIIGQILPAYPEIALRAGIEGSVWVKVLIDRDGYVRDALILRESGQNAGFEEAAIDAAKKSIWKPAISGGQPVAVWISYKVEFRLRK